MSSSMHAVIIGAGQTGRGFIAPILQEAGYHLTFLDQNAELIARLRKEKQYTIRYFQNEWPARTIRDFDAFCTAETDASCQKLNEADLVILSVFATNIPRLIPLLKKAAADRKTKMQIICCENGVNVKQPLVDAEIDAVISEGIIFCTTLQPDHEKLDLISQAYPDLPVDGAVKGLHPAIPRMPLEMHFSNLIHRKIYTYNFISAVISYFGSYKGYELYGDGANDAYIASFIDRITPMISRVIARVYDVSFDEQLAFTCNAVKKFRNRAIVDTIERNARQADRKLGVNERMLSPLKFCMEQGEPTEQIETVIAAAMYYGKVQENFDPAVMKDRLVQIQADQKVTAGIYSAYEKFLNHDTLSRIYPITAGQKE